MSHDSSTINRRNTMRDGYFVAKPKRWLSEREGDYNPGNCPRHDGRC
jgi:hypothetical protein